MLEIDSSMTYLDEFARSRLPVFGGDGVARRLAAGSVHRMGTTAIRTHWIFRGGRDEREGHGHAIHTLRGLHNISRQHSPRPIVHIRGHGLPGHPEWASLVCELDCERARIAISRYRPGNRS